MSDLEKTITDLALARQEAPEEEPKEEEIAPEGQPEEPAVNKPKSCQRFLMYKVEYEQYQFKRIFWIAGYPKSGTTWMQLFLEAYHTSDPLNINSPLHYSHPDSYTRTYQTVSNVNIHQLQDSTLYLLRPAALINLITNHDTDIVLKTHHANIGIDEGIPLIPSALTKQALYIVRDPRDLVISLAQHLKMEIDDTITLISDQNAHIARGTQEYPNEGHFISDWSTNVLSWTQTNTYAIALVRYEDLVDQPVQHFPTVLQALGRPVEPMRITNALNQTTFPRLQAQEQENGYYGAVNGKFFNHGTSGHWKEILTQDQQHRIEERHKDVMTQLGYLKDEK